MDSSLEECEESQLLAPEMLVSKPKIVALSGNKNNNNGMAVFAVKKYDLSTNKSAIDCFVHYCDGLRTVQLTRNAWGTSSVSPVLAVGTSEYALDQLLFLKNGNIWSIPLSGGEGCQVAAFPLEVQAFKLFVRSDQSLHVALVMDVYPDKTPSETADIDAAAEKGPKSSGMVFDKLMVRHWDTWAPYSKRNHVFVCPVEVTESGLFKISPEYCVDIMRGMETDCPGKAPGLGEEEFTISPDGNSVAFAARRPTADNQQRRDMAWCTDVPIFTVDISNYQSEVPQPVIVSGAAWVGYNSQPSFSPDGTKLAFLSMKRAQYESDQNNIRVLDIATSAVVSITDELSMSFGCIEWSLTDPNVLFSTAQYRGSNKLFKLKLSSDSNPIALSSIHVMTGDESRSNPVVVKYNDSEDGLYFLESSLSSPNVIVLTVLSPESDVFTPFDRAFLLSTTPTEVGEVPIVTTPECGRYRFPPVYNPTPEFGNGDVITSPLSSHYIRGGNGDLVHCWYLPPTTLPTNDDSVSYSSAVGAAVGSKAPKSVPLLLIIHGGPQGAILNSWHYRWHLGIFAAMGYGVIAVNFHGSTGYGQEFCDSIKGDWGGKPYEDCMAAVEYALATYSYLDGDRVAALGASYGGYMINWINGHTDRFKCLVNHDGIFSLRSLYYTTEELYFPEYEFGLPWVNPASNDYARFSPDNFLSSWKTPTLVIQGGKDYRVGESEALSTFTALQRQSIPSKLLYFPDENHWVLKPLNSLKWHETIKNWLAEWLA